MNKKTSLSQNSSSIMLRSFTALIIVIMLISSLATVVAVGHQLLELSQTNTTHIITSLKKTVIDGDDDWENWRNNSTMDTSTSYVHVTNMRRDAKVKNYYSPDTDDLLESKIRKIPFIDHLYYSNRDGFVYYASGHARGIKYQLWTKLGSQLEILEHVIIVTIIILVITLLISPLYIRSIANRLTEALERLTDQVHKISSQVNEHGIKNEIQLSVPTKPTEVTNLTTSFNSLLQQLYDQTEKEKLFVSNAAHELRTPIATIRSHAQLIKRRGDAHPEIVPHSIDYIDDESHQMQALVENLLALSRADRLTYDQQPFDLSAALQTLAQKMTPVLQQSLITQIPAGITVTAHAPSIEKIITNFLSNAGKYSPVTSTITLTLQRTDQGTQVAVTDQGPGISAEDQAHIFERFYRGSDTRGTIPGTGLGMAIAKQLADANQCTITIENQHPTGTKFILTFH